MKAREDEGNLISSQDPGSLLTLGSSTSYNLKEMEFTLQGVWNYSSHSDYNIVNPPKFVFFLCKNTALEMLRKPFNHLKVWFTSFRLLKKICFQT